MNPDKHDPLILEGIVPLMVPGIIVDAVAATTGIEVNGNDFPTQIFQP
jgi:hypothetical protein